MQNNTLFSITQHKGLPTVLMGLGARGSLEPSKQDKDAKQKHREKQE